MNLTPNDYKSMICARADHIRMNLYPNQYGNAVPQAVNAPAPVEPLPDFDGLKQNLSELIELVQDFERSLSPA